MSYNVLALCKHGLWLKAHVSNSVSEKFIPKSSSTMLMEHSFSLGQSSGENVCEMNLQSKFQINTSRK